MTAQLDAVLSAVDQHRLRGDIELDRATALVSRSLATATDALDHEVWRLFDGDGGNEPFDLAAVGERADRALVQAEAALAAVDDALSAVERILGARQAREENRAQAEVRWLACPSFLRASDSSSPLCVPEGPAGAVPAGGGGRGPQAGAG